jgi:hypothetical protein
VLVGAALGSCARNDPDVGATAFCGEAVVGVDWPFHSKWRLSGELGFGWRAHRVAGNPDLGVSSSAGGLYGAPRILIGRDATSLFYWRFGLQLPFYSFTPLAQGTEFVIDLGTRAVNRLEFGPRGFIGWDPVTTTGGPTTHPMDYGVTLLARYLFL